MHDLRDIAIANLKHSKETKKTCIKYGYTTLLMIVIWSVTGMGYFWPAWVITAFAISLLVREKQYRLRIQLKRSNTLNETEIENEINRIRSQEEKNS